MIDDHYIHDGTLWGVILPGLLRMMRIRNVSKGIINYPYVDGLCMFVPPIYGEFGMVDPIA